jgi:hypothetical protein
MNVYHAACDLVRFLLEDQRLKKAKDWDYFTKTNPGYDKPHGMQEFLDNVAAQDVPAFCDAMLEMQSKVITVPDGKWCLKMPGGYGIYGEDGQGRSVLGKTEAKVADSQLVDNPVMSPVQNRNWRKGL